MADARRACLRVPRRELRPGPAPSKEHRQTRGSGARSGRAGGQQGREGGALVPGVLRKLLHLLPSPRAPALQPQVGSRPPPRRPLLAATETPAWGQTGTDAVARARGGPWGAGQSREFPEERPGRCHGKLLEKVLAAQRPRGAPQPALTGPALQAQGPAKPQALPTCLAGGLRQLTRTLGDSNKCLSRAKQVRAGWSSPGPALAPCSPRRGGRGPHSAGHHAGGPGHRTADSAGLSQADPGQHSHSATSEPWEPSLKLPSPHLLICKRRKRLG